MRRIAALFSLFIAGCLSESLEGAESSSAAQAGLPTDLTNFVIDTPEEKRLYDKMRQELVAQNLSYDAVVSVVEPFVAAADSSVQRLYRNGTLSKEEVGSIYFYSTAAYAWLNGPLRTRDSVALGKWQSVIQVLASAINKLPSFECTVKRGTGLPAAVLDAMVVGSTFSEPAFLSTTLGRIPKQFVKEVEMTVHSDRCHVISWASYYPNEKEVLFPPGSQFKVRGRRNCANGGPREVCIDLEHVTDASAALVATGSAETEPSNGAKGVDRSFLEREFRGKTFHRIKKTGPEVATDLTKFVHFATTRVGTWKNTVGENTIVDWVLHHDDNVIELTYRRPASGNRHFKAYFLVLSETEIGRLYGRSSAEDDEEGGGPGPRIAEYYRIAP